MPHRIEATFQIVTPMFLGGATSQELANTIRPPSVKGALRFWWRALMWPEIARSCSDETDKKSALEELHYKEAQRFGLAAETGKNYRKQAAIHVRTISSKLSTEQANTYSEAFKKRPAARYFGYGLMGAFGKDAGKLVRPCIKANQTFELKLSSRSEITEDVICAVQALGLLGGLGSRVRKGIGSLTLHEMSVDNLTIYRAPTTQEEYVDQIQRLLPQLNQTLTPPFSAFSENSRIDLLFHHSDAMDALNELAKRQMLYRSWGHKANNDTEHKILEKYPSEKRFRQDHDWYTRPRDRSSSFHPRRIIFGLPHNYHKNDLHHVNPEKLSRRTSPLFLHIQRLNENKYLAVSTLFEADFLPKNEKIKAGRISVTCSPDWSVLTNFLDGNTGRNDLGPDRFENRTTIIGAKKP